MKKINKKAVSVLLAALMLCGTATFAGCDEPDKLSYS